MYVHSLSIKNLRSFRAAKVQLLYPGRRRTKVDLPTPRLKNVNVILGINGSGKSTILDATALGLLSPLIASSGYRPYSLIRRSNRGVPPNARIDVEVVLGSEEIKTPLPARHAHASMSVMIERRGDVEFVRPFESESPAFEGLYFDDSPAFFFVGYGATRRVDIEASGEAQSRRKLRHPRYERVASLFEDHFALTPLSSWLPDWRHRDAKRYNEAVALLGKLLPAGIKFTGELENGEYLFSFQRNIIPFGALSDGYRAYIGWVGDLLQHLCAASPKPMPLMDLKGAVMVDEIDLHIHPEWQRTIIPKLARSLRNLQFIFTTHSPLVVGTLEQANILTVERRRGAPVIGRPNEEVFGLTADQILRSDLFGLPSTRDASFKRELDRLAIAAAKGDSDAAMVFMRRASRGAGAALPESQDQQAPPWLRKMASRSAS
jgi:energy-coupling factor transporter ATP-binding protein EcfA2